MVWHADPTHLVHIQLIVKSLTAVFKHHNFLTASWVKWQYSLKSNNKTASFYLSSPYILCWCQAVIKGGEAGWVIVFVNIHHSSNILITHLTRKVNFKYIYFCCYSKSIIQKDWPGFFFLYNRLILNSNCPRTNLVADLQILVLFQHFLITYWEMEPNYCFSSAVKLWAPREVRKQNVL